MAALPKQLSAAALSIRLGLDISSIKGARSGAMALMSASVNGSLHGRSGVKSPPGASTLEDLLCRIHGRSLCLNHGHCARYVRLASGTREGVTFHRSLSWRSAP